MASAANELRSHLGDLLVGLDRPYRDSGLSSQPAWYEMATALDSSGAITELDLMQLKKELKNG